MVQRLCASSEAGAIPGLIKTGNLAQGRKSAEETWMKIRRARWGTDWLPAADKIENFWSEIYGFEGKM